MEVTSEHFLLTFTEMELCSLGDTEMVPLQAKTQCSTVVQSAQGQLVALVGQGSNLALMFCVLFDAVTLLHKSAQQAWGSLSLEAKPVRGVCGAVTPF